MAKKNKGKKQQPSRRQQQQTQQSFLDKQKQQFQEIWKTKSPVIVFLLSFIGVIVLFYLFYASDAYANYVRDPLLAVQSSIAGFFINLLGYTPAIEGNRLMDPGGFSMSIAKGCDGIEATMLFLAAILVFPLSFRLKWPGLLIGLGILFVVNIIRLIVLYLVGVNMSEAAFEFMHLHGGLILFTIISISIWLLWIDWAFRKQKETNATTN